jgi:hypothetical protein
MDRDSQILSTEILYDILSPSVREFKVDRCKSPRFTPSDPGSGGISLFPHGLECYNPELVVYIF